MMKLVENEIQSSLRGGEITAISPASRTILAGRLYASAGAYTGSELTGNCRLSWYDHLLRNPLKAPAEAEEFTRCCTSRLWTIPPAWGRRWPLPSEKLDLGRRKPRAFIPVHSPQEALEVVKQALVEAQTAYAAAWRR